jgi:hypothetical protein
MSEFDPNSTTTLKAKEFGHEFLIATKSMPILIGICIVAALVFLSLQVWDLRVKIEINTLALQAMARVAREQLCIASLPDSDKRPNMGLAACKRMGEVQ